MLAPGSGAVIRTDVTEHGAVRILHLVRCMTLQPNMLPQHSAVTLVTTAASMLGQMLAGSLTDVLHRNHPRHPLCRLPCQLVMLSATSGRPLPTGLRSSRTSGSSGAACSTCM